jgi:ADP-ribose pyrophosphatase
MSDAPTPASRTVYAGRIVRLELEQVELPNGARAEFEIVRHPGGAAVVALDAAGRVCLLRQYRPALGAWLWELPAGKLDAGEPPLVAAQRELAEEAGRRAGDWQPLGRMVSSPGVFTEVVHLYLARALEPVATAAEAHEVFEIHWLEFAPAVERARRGEIDDAKSVIGLLRAHAFLATPA